MGLREWLMTVAKSKKTTMDFKTNANNTSWYFFSIETDSACEAALFWRVNMVAVNNTRWVLRHSTLAKNQKRAKLRLKMNNCVSFVSDKTTMKFLEVCILLKTYFQFILMQIISLDVYCSTFTVCQPSVSPSWRS